MRQLDSGVSRLLAFVLLLVLLSSCASQEPEFSASLPTSSPEPVTATSMPPSATPTKTPLPPTTTFTSLPPTSTPTLKPTRTPTETPTETPTLTPTPSATPVASSGGWGATTDSLLVYYIQLETGGTAGCGDSVIGLSTGQTRSGDIAKDVKLALQQLLANKNKYAGQFYNPVSLSNISVETVKYDDKSGLITVNLRGTYVRSGDDCDNTRVKAQVWSTIRQFRDVKMTNIYLNGGPFGDKVSNDK